MTFREWLLTNPSTRNACDDALEWIGNRTFQESWDECPRPDWMLWLCGRMVGQPGWPTRQQIVLVACDIARSVIHLTRPEDREICLAAIVAAEEWANGIGTADAAYASARAAYAAAYAVYAAAYAVYASARAAYAAAYVADAAYVAGAAYAAYVADAATYAARATKRSEICDLIRARIDVSRVTFPGNE